MVLPWFGLDAAAAATAFEPAFAARPDWQRIYVDLPGTGDSAPVAPHSDAVLDAVVATVEALLGAESFALAGCSYGGYLATAVTRRVPHRVQALLLVCSGVKIRPADRDLAGVLDSVPEPGWLDGVPPSLHPHFTQAIGRQTAGVAARIAAALDAAKPTDDAYLEVLRSTGYQLSDEASDDAFQRAVTMVAGRQDRVAGYRDQFGAMRRYPRGTFIALSEAGHYLPFEQPERFAAILRDWLDQCGQRP